MALELYYGKGDIGPTERMRLIDTTTGLPQDLTGKTVALPVRMLGQTTIVDTVPGIVIDPANGRLSITWPASVLAAAGKLLADVIVTAGSEVTTARDAVTLIVRDRP